MVHKPKIGVYWLMSHIHRPNPKTVAFAIRHRSQKSLNKPCSRSMVYDTILRVIQAVSNYYFKKNKHENQYQ